MSKRKIKILVGILLSFSLLFNLFLVYQFATANSYNKKYSEEVIKNYKKDTPVFVNKDLDDYSVTYSYDTSKYNKFDTIIQRITGVRYTKEVSTSVDKSKVSEWIDNYNKTATKSKDAKIIKGKKRYKISSHVVGTKVNKNKILKRISNTTRGLDIENYYIQPKIKSQDLEEKVKEINKFIDWQVTYTNNKTIKSSIDYISMDKDGNIIKDSDFIRSWVYNTLGSYSTVGEGFEFKSHIGKKLKVKGGTFGTLVNYEEEINFLTDLFNKGKSLSKKRKPIFSQEYKSIGNTFVEVDKSNQYVYVYKKGKLVMSSPCVTGQRGVHDTPTGTYFISECIPGKYLVGDGYRTWVNRWMRLTNMGIGLHDATWRGSFGGSIYTYSGSHGCINLPYDFACRLYKLAYVGMPVVIHY